MNITINPTDSEIDRDLELCDEVIVFHNSGPRKRFITLLDRIVDAKKNKVVYIHLYQKESQYTVGIKKRDSIETKD